MNFFILRTTRQLRSQVIVPNSHISLRCTQKTLCLTVMEFLIMLSAIDISEKLDKAASVTPALICSDKLIFLYGYLKFVLISTL